MEHVPHQHASQPIKINSKFIIPLAMIFVTVTLAADVVAYKLTTIGPFIESGATILFPLTYLIGDVITENYGYELARKFIWYNLAAELFFATVIFLVASLPAAPNWQLQKDYQIVLNPILRFVGSAIIGNIVSSFLNIYLISKWKIFTKGKHFWLRSIGATSISELSLVFLTGFFAFFGKMPFHRVIFLLFSAYLLEMFYALIFVWPGYLLVLMVKRTEHYDVYDYDVNYNPFKGILDYD